MASQDTKVFCSFCNEEFSSSKTMGDHLMMCGNKTDQCPNCRQFIRRAIFAYHYENNCANPDAPTRDNESNQKAQDTTRSQQFNDSNDNAFIPCEYCNQGIQWDLYDNHTKACREEYYKQLQEKTRRSSQQPAPATTTAKCIHCRLLRSLEGLAYHQGQVNDAERLISCSFCNEKFMSTKEMGDHLLMCGNKTDQCPHCKKFIRRAVFAYHYENNCTDLDDTDNDTHSHANKPVVSPTFHPNNSLLSSTRSAAGQEKKITIMTVNLRTPSDRETTTFQRSNSGIRTTVLCQFCNCECDPADLEAHRSACLKNPDKIKKKHPAPTDGDFNQYRDRLHHDDQSDDTALIPCEYCKKPIEWRLFQEHTNSCAKQEHERIQQQSRVIHQDNNNYVGRCRYCNAECSMDRLTPHE
ncbi:unnamed protein product, partial [Rotaria sordida]